jgi:drug/metabolite transporter (DMT)-like permease
VDLLKTYIMTALAAIFWGANFNLAKPVVAEMGPYVAGASRYLMAAAIMLLVSLIIKQKIELRYLRNYVILGLVGVFGFNIFFFLGLQTTSAVNAALIMALNPLLTAVLAFAIFKDRPTSRQVIAFPLGIFGVAVVVLGAGAHVMVTIGDAYIFLASLSWAFYNVLLKKYMPGDVGGISSTAVIMTVGALALTAVCLVSGEKFMVPTLATGLALAVMVVCGGILAYLFWNAGVAKLGASKAAIFLNLVPVTSIVIAAIEGLPPSHVQMVGAAIVITAVTFGSSAKKSLA